VTIGRVVHVVKTKGMGGCERHLLTLLPGLRQRGIDVALVLLLEPSHARIPVVDAFRQLGLPTDMVTLRLDFDPLAVVNLVRALRRQRPALVHTHLVHADVHGTAASSIAGVEAIVGSRHNLLTERGDRKVVKAVASQAARRAQRIIAISDAVARAVQTVERVPPDQVRRIYYGIPFGAPSPLGPPGVVGTATRLVPEKDLETLIRAWALVEKRPGRRLLLAGEGPLEPELRRMVASMGLEDWVEFVGFVPDVGALHRRISVFVQTSHGEGLGLAAVEAAGAGLPVVASHVGALPEVVVDRETGFLAPPGDPQRLADALTRLLDDPSHARRLGEAASAHARRTFSLERMLAETVTVYEECLV
jgi:glycosyltransferase involved in cell wall biosynthesis